jgi:succinate dehydrogenase / fumarate reductase iron-sulfur subunit
MTTNVSKSTANVRVQRFNPESDRKPRIQEFRVEITQDTTILDALHEIKSHQDGSLTYRRSCRHAICGSCAMNVNGKNILVCKTPLKDHLDSNGSITIKPLPYLPVIKDLVVDRTSFWEQYLRVKPWLLSLGDAPEKEFRMSPDEVAGLQKAETCIMCGACYSSCTVVAGSKRYIGPHALLKSYMRVMDPRDSRPGERLVEVGTDEGVFRCHTIFNCIDACPKNLDPTKAIETLRQLVLKRKSFEAARQERQKTLDKPVVVVE